MCEQIEREKGKLRVEGLKFIGVHIDLSSEECPIIIDIFLKRDQSKTASIAFSEDEARRTEVALRSAREFLERRKKELKFFQKPNFIPK